MAGKQGDPSPRILELSPEAKRVWIDFYNDSAERQEALNEELRAHAAKLVGYAARLALVVHVVRQVTRDRTLRYASTIDGSSVQSATELVEWFGREARRVQARLGASPRERQLLHRAEVIQTLGGAVAVRDWQRRRGHTAAEARLELEAGTAVAAVCVGRG